jgi:hypothetical protein
MDLRIFLVADFANLDPGGKLNVIGAFNQIWVKRFPVVHPSMYLVAKVYGELGEFGKERDYTVLFFDEDANELGKMEGKFTFPQPKGQQPYSEFNLIVALRDVHLAKQGRYEFRLLVNDNLLGTVPLDVIKAPEVPQE